MKDMEEIIDIMIHQNMVGINQQIMNFILEINIIDKNKKGVFF